MKLVEIILRRGKRIGRMMGGINLTYIVSTYVNITIYLLYSYYTLIIKIRRR
jgi:hypothetical protein